MPPPKVTWWRNGVLFDSSDEVSRSSGVIVNQMVQRSLQREDLGSRFVCQATNTNLTGPVAREVKLVLNCKFPIKIELV